MQFELDNLVPVALVTDLSDVNGLPVVDLSSPRKIPANSLPSEGSIPREVDELPSRDGVSDNWAPVGGNLVTECPAPLPPPPHTQSSLPLSTETSPSERE